MRYAWILIIGFALAGCTTDSSPVAPIGSTATSIEAATVMVNGTPVNGGVVSGERGQTMFQVMLRDRDNTHLASVEHCEVRYDLPGMGMMSGRRSGEALCYDDGTHGDDVPGDGIYHYLDMDDNIGCGRAGMPGGNYDYRFHCMFDDGSESELSVAVTRQ